jgi:hypothetical protein
MAVTVVLPSLGAGPEDIAPMSSVEDSPVAAPITVAGMCHRRKTCELAGCELGLFVAARDSNATGRATISNNEEFAMKTAQWKRRGFRSSAI